MRYDGRYIVVLETAVVALKPQQIAVTLWTERHAAGWISYITTFSLIGETQ